jgi:hypothetical protein
MLFPFTYSSGSENPEILTRQAAVMFFFKKKGTGFCLISLSG